MKSFIILLVAIFLSIPAVQAQQTTQTPTKTEQPSTIDMLAKKLNLSVTQKRDVAKTLTSFKATEDRLNASTMTQGDKDVALAKLAARKNSNIETYLSEEQFAQYKKLTNN